MCVDSVASQVLSQACVSETCLSVLFQVVVIVGGFNTCIRCCWCFSCGRLLVVVGVGDAFMFVRDGYFSQAGSYLHCWIRVRVRVEDLFAGAFCCLIRLVQPQVYVHHGVDSFGLFFCSRSLFFTTSRGCWLCSTSLPAVTRLTVYRRPQVQYP